MIARALHLVGAVAFALVVTGGGQALHRALEHSHDAPGSSHSCADVGVSAETSTPDETPEREPSRDHECPVCVTLKSADHTFTALDAPLTIDTPALVGVERPRRVAPAYARAWSAGPPRAPPVCA